MLALREVDLSVGSLVALSGVVCAATITGTGNIALGVLASSRLALRLVCSTGSPSPNSRSILLIATLAMMEIVRGLAFLTSGGEAVPISQEGFYLLGSGELLGVGYPVWITLALFVLFGVVLNATVFGKNVLAMRRQSGSGAAGGRAGGSGAGIIVFAVHGLVTAPPASCRRRGSRRAGRTRRWVLSCRVISACVSAAYRSRAWVATIGGVIIGVLIMGAAQNALNLLNVPDLLSIRRPRRHSVGGGRHRSARATRAGKGQGLVQHVAGLTLAR